MGASFCSTAVVTEQSDRNKDPADKLLDCLPFAWTDFCACKDTFISEEPALFNLLATIWRRGPRLVGGSFFLTFLFPPATSFSSAILPVLLLSFQSGPASELASLRPFSLLTNPVPESASLQPASPPVNLPDCKLPASLWPASVEHDHLLCHSFRFFLVSRFGLFVFPVSASDPCVAVHANLVTSWFLSSW